jgi:beta-glucosidase/6-phospho-beta-glucosidase/beta-galactosidase
MTGLSDDFIWGVAASAYQIEVARRLGDRVGIWATINEMFEHVVLGHVTGEHAPGLRLPLGEAAVVAHHLLLAHGSAVRVFRAAGQVPIMAINSYSPVRPDGDGPGMPPLIVSENGCAGRDVLAADGRCDDPHRVAYLSAHVDAVRAVRAAGVDVRGFFVWSLLDTFEWAAGYTQRFGLVHVDHATQRRTPKTSYTWLRDTIAASRRSTAGTVR